MATHEPDPVNPGVLFGVDRWKVAVPITDSRPAAVEGISEHDAVALGRRFRGAVWKSHVWLYGDGTEVREPWELHVDFGDEEELEP